MLRGIFFVFCLTVTIIVTVEACSTGDSGCKDKLPSKMSSDEDCKKLSTSCSKLSKKCDKELGDAIGSPADAKECKDELGNDAKKKVEKFCKKTCKKCDWVSFLLFIQANVMSWSRAT